MIAQDAKSHLHAELRRTASLLGARLQALRERGKSPAGEMVGGLVIEDGEAEGLVAELTDRWSRPPGPEPIAAPHADDLGDPALPLRHAAARFELGAVENDALLLALAVELDGAFGRLVAYLNDHMSRTRPTLGLALSPVDGGVAPLSPLGFCRRPAIRDGLLEVDADGPAPGWTLRTPEALVARLTGEAPLDALPDGFARHAPDAGLLDRLVLRPNIRQALAAWMGSPQGLSPRRSLILAGAPGSGRRTVARGVAGALAWPLLATEVRVDQPTERLRAARREGRWSDSPLLLRLTAPDLVAEIDWRPFWTELADMRQPLFLAVHPAHAEALAAAAFVEPTTVTLSEPALDERAALWRALTPGLAPEAADQLGARFHFNAGRIARAVRRAGESPGPEALARACREIGGATMGPLAQKLPLPYAWEDLVVPPEVREELDLARVWMAQQRQVLDHWGFGRRVASGRGMTMLFGGPPGTGKTMAAQVLAAALELDLYRVDLSRVVNKYIGETEKNLARLFDEARASGAALFFDEADALFGRRSEVKDAHDRYANLEIGYLLQRMEDYEGVTMLASNRARDMDEAFTRRFHFIVDFPMPDEAHRLKIWRGMFPAETALSESLDLASVAKRFEMSGGEIKNAALSAAFAAAGEGRPLSTEHVMRAVRREFRKAGRLAGR
jgi:hypothetical protein